MVIDRPLIVVAVGQVDGRVDRRQGSLLRSRDTGWGLACRRVTAPARESSVAGSSPARPRAERLAAVSRSHAASSRSVQVRPGSAGYPACRSRRWLIVDEDRFYSRRVRRTASPRVRRLRRGRCPRLPPPRRPAGGSAARRWPLAYQYRQPSTLGKSHHRSKAPNDTKLSSSKIGVARAHASR
jgi:hypothetical protein